MHLIYIHVHVQVHVLFINVCLTFNRPTCMQLVPFSSLLCYICAAIPAFFSIMPHTNAYYMVYALGSIRHVTNNQRLFNCNIIVAGGLHAVLTYTYIYM